MNVDYLIIGQGVAGTWLSYFLSKEKKTFIIIDEIDRYASSRVAAGLINPVTGRRIVKTWRIDELLPFAEKHYTQLGEELGIRAISRRTIVDFFSAPDVKLAFENKLSMGEDYIRRGPDDLFSEYFHPGFGCGIIEPAFTAHLDIILPAWRNKLEAEGRIRNAKYLEEELKVFEDHVQYHDITTSRIIYCDGIAAARSVYFSKLPFTLHKGEALILEIPGLPQDHIYKKGLALVPLSGKDIFWMGSNYSWHIQDPYPTEAYKSDALLKLKNWIKIPYRLIDHKAAIRPATIERRPFIGIHPLYPSVGLFNGLGTKGCSLGPFFAHELVEHLIHGKPLTPQVDIQRFSRILKS